MNKQEAIDSMRKGDKVTHKLFLENHYLKRHTTSLKHFLDEGENVIDAAHFWKYRTSPKWNRGWEIYVKPIRRKNG